MFNKTYFKRGIQYILHGVPTVQKTVNVSISQLNNDELLKGRTALITGGTSGIGLAIAQSFVQAGANCIITGRSIERLEEAQRIICSNTNKTTAVSSCVMNLRDVPSLSDAFQEALSLSPTNSIDILVNNGGVLQGASFGGTVEEDYDATMETNLKGTYFISQIVAKHMKEKGIKGNILNIASSSSLRPANSAYSISKWGIRGFTLGLARVLTPYDIVVNGIAPGPTATPMLKKEDDNLSHPKSLSGRYIHPMEVGNMAVVLVSDMSRMVVGDIIYMTGGAGLLTSEDVEFHF